MIHAGSGVTTNSVALEPEWVAFDKVSKKDDGLHNKYQNYYGQFPPGNRFQVELIDMVDAAISSTHRKNRTVGSFT